jgi:hypothetical protein
MYMERSSQPLQLVYKIITRFLVYEEVSLDFRPVVNGDVIIQYYLERRLAAVGS